jgi:hypothetical protein
MFNDGHQMLKLIEFHTKNAKESKKQKNEEMQLVNHHLLFAILSESQAGSKVRTAFDAKTDKHK